ncbi:MAG: class I SAM-dependent methyltransferase [Magnetococcus sp. DMHC-6]
MIRKFLFSRAMLNRLARIVPYYTPSPAQFNPEAVLDGLWPYLLAEKLDYQEKTILELGSGSTNGVGYHIVARGAARCFCLEPFMPFAEQLDAKHRNAIQRDHPDVMTRVIRATQWQEIPDRSIELVISNAVLEHIYDFPALLEALIPKLKPQAYMLHMVDYRDHFFKYPLHFLQFSDRIWNRFLDPGNMPRPRICDHINTFSAAGFNVRILGLKVIQT